MMISLDSSPFQVLVVSRNSAMKQNMRLLIFLCFCLFLPNTAQASAVRTTPLIRAVQSGHMRLIGQFIRGGAQVNTIDVLGRAATHYAVSNNNMPALKLLLAKGADVNLADNGGHTPLDMWYGHKNEEMLELLHAAGAKPLDLWQAAANNDRASAERLLAAGADTKAKNDAGKAPFDIAVEAEHYALAAILAKAAGGIDGKDRRGWRPLHWAILSDDWGLVREFIREGADVNVGYSQNALDIAKLMQSETKLTESLIAEKGVDATFGWSGKTLLLQASERKQAEIVKLLIDNGADPNIKSRQGETALMLAAEQGYKVVAEREREYTEIVKILIDNNADLNIKSGGGYSALMYAVSRGGHTEIVELLIDNGADLNIETNSNETALMRSATRGHIEMVKLLIDNGADLNIKNSGGNTALMFAASSGHTEIVKLLLDNKADLNIKNMYGETALGIAERKGHQEIIDILRAAQQGSI